MGIAQVKVVKRSRTRSQREANDITKMKWMVAVDSSEYARKAFDRALQLMNPDTDELFVISVAEDHRAIVMGPYADYGLHLQLEQKIEDQTRTLLRSYAAKCRARNLKFACLLGRGAPGEAICNEAAARNVDAIVVGRHGADWMERLVLGSTSNYLVHNAKCSIMVVKGLEGKGVVE